MARVGQRQLLTYVGIGIVVGFGLIFVYLLFIRGQTSGIQDVNAIECAAIARELARTGHFATPLLKPLSLARVPRPDDHPDLIYAPLHPLWESLWVRLLPYERAIPLACGAWLFLGGLLMLVLGWAWFSPRVGCLAAVLYVMNLNMLVHAAGGTEAPMLGFLLLALMGVVAAFAHAQRKSLLLALATGAVAGLLCLTKYVWGTAIIPAALAVFLVTPREQRTRMLAACAAAFLVVLLPWMVRNTLVVGDPLFSFRWLESVMHTRTYPGNTLYRTFTTEYPSWLLFAVTSPREVITKALEGLDIVYAQPISAPGAYLGALFVAAIIVGLGSRSFEVARYVLYGSYVLAVAAMLILLPAQRLTAPIAAPATLIAVAFFVTMLQRATQSLPEKAQRRYMVTGILVLSLIHVFPLLGRLGSGRPEAAVRADRVRMQAQQAASLVDGLVATDVPWPICWYGDCKTLWLPKSPEELAKVEKEIGPVRWLLLTSFSRATQEEERTEAWASMWMRALQEDVVADGFRVYKRLPGNWVLFQRTTAPQR